MYKAVFFDLDGTLIESYFNDGNARDYHAVSPLPQRIERLVMLQRQGVCIGIVTNQGGIAFGYHTEADFEAKIANALAALELPAATLVRVCYHHPKASIAAYADPAGCERRKPSGAMITELCQHYGVNPSDVVFVGDRDEDQQAAVQAGVNFQWAHDFFGV